MHVAIQIVYYSPTKYSPIFLYKQAQSLLILLCLGISQAYLVNAKVTDLALHFVLWMVTAHQVAMSVL